VIRAAEGVQPLLRFVEPPSPDRVDAGCLTVVSGTLELQGVVLRPAFLITGAARPAVVAVEGASVLRCRDVGFRLPVGDATYCITFDDWMWQMNDGVLINRSYLKKFGITVAELSLFMQKQKP
jgi:hypothetical protein